jgi:hypothetical protein
LNENRARHYAYNLRDSSPWIVRETMRGFRWISPGHAVARWLAQRALPIAIAIVSVSCESQTQQSRRPQTAGPGASTSAAPAGNSAVERRVTFNGRTLDALGWRVLGQIETFAGGKLPDGAYWYDPISGAAGKWGGPAAILLLPGLPLGGALPAQASGGGNGRVTGIFVNGRELHRDDVRALLAIYGQAWPGRWWVNAAGDFGVEGGPPVGNLRRAAAQGGGSWSRGSGAGSNGFWAGGDGNGYVWAMDGYSGCSYASDGGGVIC